MWNIFLSSKDPVSTHYHIKSHLAICSIFGRHLYKTFTNTFSALFYAFPGDTSKNILRRIISRNWEVEERLLFFKENALFANFWDSSLMYLKLIWHSLKAFGIQSTFCLFTVDDAQCTESKSTNTEKIKKELWMVLCVLDIQI